MGDNFLFNINQKNIKEIYKVFKAIIWNFFTGWSKYVEDNFILMYNHIKFVLKPLLGLKKMDIGFFLLKGKKKFYHDLTLFKDKTDLTEVLFRTTDFFKWKIFEQTIETEPEQLNEFDHKGTNINYYLYSFTNTIREGMKKPKLIHTLILIIFIRLV